MLDLYFLIHLPALITKVMYQIILFISAGSEFSVTVIFFCTYCSEFDRRKQHIVLISMTLAEATSPPRLFLSIAHTIELLSTCEPLSAEQTSPRHQPALYLAGAHHDLTNSAHHASLQALLFSS